MVRWGVVDGRPELGAEGTEVDGGGAVGAAGEVGGCCVAHSDWSRLSLFGFFVASDEDSLLVISR